jgi:hypothetical protein
MVTITATAATMFRLVIIRFSSRLFFPEIFHESADAPGSAAVYYGMKLAAQPAPDTSTPVATSANSGFFNNNKSLHQDP